MNSFTVYIIATFIVSMVCGMISIPFIINFCKEKNLYDTIGTRKIHKANIPRLGGICFMPSMTIASVATILAFNITSQEHNGITISPWSATFVVSILLIYVCGIVDDLVELTPVAKFIVQVIAASMVVISGLYIYNLYGFLGIYEVPAFIGIPITVLTMVFISNAFNLIDGIDGLAAGLSLIAFAGFLLCFTIEGMPIFCILIAGLMGVLLTFMYFNVFGSVHRSTKIFMGDSGSLTIGFCLSFLFVKLIMDDASFRSIPTDRLLIASSLIAVPVLDTLRVIFSRIFHRTGVFTADKNHLHHKLLRADLSQRQALVVILFIALAIILLNLGLAHLLSVTAIALLDIILFALVNIFINHKIKQKGHNPFVVTV